MYSLYTYIHIHMYIYMSVRMYECVVCVLYFHLGLMILSLHLTIVDILPRL